MNPAASTTRILWLVFERVPHPDAVSYPADEDDIRLVLSLLDYPQWQRREIVEKLRRILDVVYRKSPFDRPTIPARTPSGLYRPISWRFAKWLACVLHCEGSQLEQLTARLRSWLTNDRTHQMLDPHQWNRIPSITGVLS